MGTGAAVTYLDQKTNDGFRSLIVDPSESLYTLSSLLWSSDKTT